MRGSERACVPRQWEKAMCWSAHDMAGSRMKPLSAVSSNVEKQVVDARKTRKAAVA